MTWKDAVGLALEGREEGYNFLYQQTYQKSYYVALKYMKQEEEAADVLQDAYIKAFQNLDQLQEPDKFPGWFSRWVPDRCRLLVRQYWLWDYGGGPRAAGACRYSYVIDQPDICWAGGWTDGDYRRGNYGGVGFVAIDY